MTEPHDDTIARLMDQEAEQAREREAADEKARCISDTVETIETYVKALIYYETHDDGAGYEALYAARDALCDRLAEVLT